VSWLKVKKRGYYFGHPAFLLGHPATKVKKLKCLSPFFLLKTRVTRLYELLFMDRFRYSSFLLLPLSCVVSLHWCFFFFLRGCWSSVCDFSYWWLLIPCYWPCLTYFLCIVLLLLRCCCFFE